MLKHIPFVGSLTLLVLLDCGGSKGDQPPTPGTVSGAATTPAPASGALPWMNTALSPAERTKALLAAMTLEQKIQQMYNLPVLNDELQGQKQKCDFTPVGRHIQGIPELKIPTFRFANGGTGVRGGDCSPEPTATAVPSAIAAAATFDRQINYEWGQVLGAEVRDWAHYTLWGPSFNMARNPYGGRGHEYMGEDPYLAGVTATEQVLGVQTDSKTQATIKHFAGNENEYQRERWTSATRIPSRAMHEIYLLPFEMAVKDAKPASVMCAFPHLNYEWACESSPLLKQTLQDRWGFDGYIVSDRRALHSTAESIHAGVGYELDFEPTFYTQEAIKRSLDTREIDIAEIDHVLGARFQKMFAFGNFDEPRTSFRDTDFAAHDAVARKAADASVVLLKNDGILPLRPGVKSVALIGAKWFAGQATMSPRSLDADELVNVEAPSTVTPRKGLENTLRALGSAASVTYDDGTDLDSAAKAAGNADVAIVMVGDVARETRDKTTLGLPKVTGTDQEKLVPRILKANPNAVVVLKTEGMVLMPWLAQARALVEAWYPGQEDGNVVADVLFGVTNPSGKLPVTFGNSDHEAAYATEEQYPGVYVDNGLGGGGGLLTGPNGKPQLVTYYSENLEMGYRWYEAHKVTPTFPFGHGLSYTSFAYGDLKLTPSSNAAGKPMLTVEYTITNTGKVAGKEASQVYLTLPAEAAEPSKRLVGFEKVDLQPGETKRVSIALDCSASNHPFSYFNPIDETNLQRWADGDWVTPSGGFVVHVGTSSAQTPLETPINLDLATCVP
jgi:beta-glucosidase